MRSNPHVLDYEHREVVMNREDFIPKIQAARILGVASRSVEPICTKNRVKVWQIPGHSRRLYYKADVMNLVALADKAAFTS